MQQDDADEFVGAVVKEVNGHVENNNWEVIKRSKVPADEEVIPSVWAMRFRRMAHTEGMTSSSAGTLDLLISSQLLFST